MNLIHCDYKEYIRNMEEKDVVVIDPPWLYEVQRSKTKKQLCYALWEDNIKELDFCFEHIKAKHILMWVTNTFLLETFRANHSEYVYKTIVTWLKKTSNDYIAYGLGSSFRNCTEHLLLFTREGETPPHLSLRNIIEEPAGNRTEKPKKYEYELFKLLEEKKLTKFAYIFSGPNVNCFSKLNIDVVDVVLQEQIENTNKYFE